MGLLKEIGKGPVALDTIAFIYFIEEHPRFLRIVKPLFSAIARGRLQAVTSALTLLEVLVIPYRFNHAALADRYEHLLTRSKGLDLVALDIPLLRLAAQLRAGARIKTPDSLQVAAAMIRGCPALVTNDRDLPELPGPRVLQISDFM